MKNDKDLLITNASLTLLSYHPMCWLIHHGKKDKKTKKKVVKLIRLNTISPIMQFYRSVVTRQISTSQTL